MITKDAVEFINSFDDSGDVKAIVRSHWGFKTPFLTVIEFPVNHSLYHEVECKAWNSHEALHEKVKESITCFGLDNLLDEFTISEIIVGLHPPEGEGSYAAILTDGICDNAIDHVVYYWVTNHDYYQNKYETHYHILIAFIDCLVKKVYNYRIDSHMVVTNRLKNNVYV